MEQHTSIVSADVKSIIYSQIHLGYFSEYLLVKIDQFRVPHANYVVSLSQNSIMR